MNRIEGVDFGEYLEFVAGQEAQSLVSMSTATEATWDRITQGVQVFGSETPWTKVNRVLRFRPGEVSIWAGVGGHGKTAILSQCSAVWMRDGPVAIASLEMPLPALAERFSYQMHGGKAMTVEEFGHIMALTDERVWVYDETDSVESTRVLGMAVYCAKELSCGHIIIDSLVKCGLNMESHKSSAAQRDFVDRLCWIAKTYAVHIHLVHHMRKGDSEDSPGGKMDVKGAGEITDLVDNVLLVWRNKPKERAMEEDPGSLKHLDEPDALLICEKQRHGEWEGRIKLWFHNDSKQFLGAVNEPPRRMYAN